MTVVLTGSAAEPIIVCVLPEPVWPYLYRESHMCTLPLMPRSHFWFEDGLGGMGYAKIVQL